METNPGVRYQMGQAGKGYVDRYYQWDMVINRLRSLIEYVVQSNRDKEK